MKTSKAEQKKILKEYLERLQLIQSNDSVNHEETLAEKEARIKLAKRDYNYFVRYYFPHWAFCDCADFQIQEANKVLKDPHFKGVMEMGRGLAKSTHWDIFVPIWLHLFHNQLYCLILVGKDYTAAKKLLSDLQAEFEVNPQLIHDFGKMSQDGSWEKGNFRTTTNLACFAKGKGQSPRGARNGPIRPQYIVIDDIDDDEECRNHLRVDNTVNWIKRALIPAVMDDYNRVIIANNRIAPYTVLSNMVENKEWKHRRVNALDEHGNPTWPQRYSKEHYERLIREIGWPAFETEFQNNPQVDGKIFRDELIQYRPVSNLKKYERIVSHWDIAYSNSKSADCNAIVVSGLIDGKIDVLKVFCRTCTMEDALRWLTWLYLKIGKIQIEWYAESQFWNTAVDIAIQIVATETGVRMPLIFTDRPGRGQNKYSRILQMLPTFQRGEIYFNEAEKHNTDMQRLIYQLKGIEPNYSGKDDGPDALTECNTHLSLSISTVDSLPIIGNRERPRRIY